MNSFLVGAAVYLCLTLAAVPTPWREILAVVAVLSELVGNYQKTERAKLKARVTPP